MQKNLEKVIFMVIQGFITDYPTLEEMEDLLGEMQAALFKKAETEYHRLLSAEIMDLVDDMALNIRERPGNISILDFARNILDERINAAMRMQAPTAYNMSAMANVFPELEKRKYCYILLSAPNPVFYKALRAIERLRPYDVSPVQDTAEQKKRAEEWKRAMELHREIPPMGVQFRLAENFTFQEKRLKFEGPYKRAEKRARWQFLNQRLGMFGMGQNIPNFKLMPYLDWAMEEYLRTEFRGELMEMKQRLRLLLPAITPDLLRAVPEQQDQAGQ